MSKFKDFFRKAGKWIKKAATSVYNKAKGVVNEVWNTAKGLVNKVADLPGKALDTGKTIVYVIGGVAFLGLAWMLLNPGKTERIAMAGISKVPTPMGATARMLT